MVALRFTGLGKSLLSRSNFTHLLLLAITLLVTISATCRSESGLGVVGDNPPVFEIRRSFFDEVRIFPMLAVVQLDSDNEKLSPLREDDSKNKVLWRIVADPGAKDTSSIERIEKIEYGKVPKGFVPEVPKEGPPPKLAENVPYEAVGPLSLMHNAAVRFKIVNGRVVTLSMPH